ncbi:glycosyltransferase family 4 protein [Pseudomonadota bacterium]
MALENRKQLTALGQFCGVEVLSPASWHEGMTHFDFCESTIEGENWNLHYLPERRIPGLPQSQYFLPGLKKRIKTINPQIIHIESDPWTTFAAQAIHARNSAMPTLPVVCTAKQNTYTTRGGIRDRIKNSLGSWGTENTARFIAVTPKVRDIYRQRFGVPPQSFDLSTHLGVDTDLFCPVTRQESFSIRQRLLDGNIAENAILVGYCGRLEKYKGVTDLIDAVESARSGASYDIRLALLGSGSLKAELISKSKSSPWLSVHDHVPHAQVASFMQALDLFVMPAQKSRFHEEHDAHAVIEALSCGLHCIGTDSGAIPGVLRDPEIIVPAGDWRQLAERLQEIVVKFSRQVDHQINAVARERIINAYSIEAVARNSYSTYLKAIKSWNGRR